MEKYIVLVIRVLKDGETIVSEELFPEYPLAKSKYYAIRSEAVISKEEKTYTVAILDQTGTILEKATHGHSEEMAHTDVVDGLVAPAPAPRRRTYYNYHGPHYNPYHGPHSSF